MDIENVKAALLATLKEVEQRQTNAEAAYSDLRDKIDRAQADEAARREEYAARERADNEKYTLSVDQRMRQIAQLDEQIGHAQERLKELEADVAAIQKRHDAIEASIESIRKKFF